MRTRFLEPKWPIENEPSGNAEVADLLDYVGLGSFSNYYPDQLSHGMRQRVALVRTLLVDPALLLLDEPFASVDYEVRLRLENYLLRRARERQTVCINIPLVLVGVLCIVALGWLLSWAVSAVEKPLQRALVRSL